MPRIDMPADCLRPPTILNCSVKAGDEAEPLIALLKREPRSFRDRRGLVVAREVEVLDASCKSCVQSASTFPAGSVGLVACLIPCFPPLTTPATLTLLETERYTQFKMYPSFFLNRTKCIPWQHRFCLQVKGQSLVFEDQCQSRGH